MSSDVRSILDDLTYTDKSKWAELGNSEGKLRAKVLAALELQIAIAAAEAERKPFVHKAPRWITDPETGNRVRKDVPVRLRKWWWSDYSGVVYVQVLYGNKPLEIKKGKTSIVLASAQDLVPTLEKLRDAVRAGELDAVLKLSKQAVARPGKNTKAPK